MGQPAPKSKFIRDPLHDIIRIDPQDDYIIRLLDTTPMQRLRRIGQLGWARLVYPGAEHSRFTHSLGVFHLAGRVMAQLDEARTTTSSLFSKSRRKILLSAALLHDVGHGPFSHVFESVTRSIGTPVDHEKWTARIINEDEEIHSILDSDIRGQVCQVINKTFKPHYVSAIISSQLDVDRFDYLLRDSYMTGTHYGAFDLEWMLRTLAVRSIPLNTGTTSGSGGRELQTLVVDGQRGLSGLEQYLLGRHYMYRHVYYHKTIRAAELMLDAIIRRATELVRGGSTGMGNAALRKMARGEPITVTEYLTLDDFVLISWIEDWAQSAEDNVLADLCTRLIKRRLMKAISIPPDADHRAYADNRSRTRKSVEAHGYDPEYYMYEDSVDAVAYKDYLYNLEHGKIADEEEIWYVDSDAEPRRLSARGASVVVGADKSKALRFHEERWFVPHDVATAVAKTLRWK